MNINELRINNLISHNGLICTVEIINGELNEIYFLGEEFYHSDKPENLEGVPLTEEVLLKSGFVYTDDVVNLNRNYKLQEFEIQLHLDVNDFICCNTIPNYIQIKYVHTLQNLYFDFTNEELASTKAN